jgi:predicted MPP superfamily phosphohydrolase
LILLYDVFLLINLFIKVLSPEKRKSYKIRRNTLLSIIVLAALVVIAGAVNFMTIRTTEYSVTVNGKSSQLGKLRLAYAADFHIDSQTSVSFVRRFAEKIEDISPDIMLYGGDIVEGHDGERMEQQEKLLRMITTKYGVYGVLGNHEYYRGQDRGSFFDKAGITVLRDTAIVFDNSFSLAGRLDSHFQDRKSAAEVVDMAPDSLPLILLDHRPTELIEVSKTRTDVQLSGHTHDGQMFPINLITRKVYLLSKGYRKIGNTHFFVTSGIRQWRFPVRTTGKSEIIVVEINFVK